MVESVAADLQDHPLLAVEKGAVDECTRMVDKKKWTHDKFSGEADEM